MEVESNVTAVTFVGLPIGARKCIQFREKHNYVSTTATCSNMCIGEVVVHA